MKIIVGLLFGAIAGILDLIPMFIQKLSWDANLSAFSMWLIIGVFISSVQFNLKPFLKGIVVSLMVLLPSAFLIGWKEPVSLIPILTMTIVLGSLLGFTIEKVKSKVTKV